MASHPLPTRKALLEAHEDRLAWHAYRALNRRRGCWGL